MKNFLLIAILFISLSASSQKISGDVYYSTNNTHIIGGTMYLTQQNTVFGIGGSHASKTFFVSEKHDGNEFMDKCYNLAPMPVNLIKFDSFTEDRGTVTASIGYKYSGFMITGEFGLGFTQTIDLYTSSNLNSKPYAWQSNGWKSQGGTRFCYGGTISQTLLNRWGIMLGYTNIQHLKMGINYNFK